MALRNITAEYKAAKLWGFFNRLEKGEFLNRPYNGAEIDFFEAATAAKYVNYTIEILIDEKQMKIKLLRT